MKIGFIGQGWIGKNYADVFEERGFDTVRFSLEEPFINNKDNIKECDIVFIAVPTPTIKGKFNYDALRESLSNVGQNKIAVIKSTVLPGITNELQKLYPDKYILHSPEFLSEATARKDAAEPKRNIIGIPIVSKEFIAAANMVLKVLPESPYDLICKAVESEFIKYAGNVLFYIKVVYINLLFDLAKECDVDWNIIQEAMGEDPRIGKSHLNPVHESGTFGGDCHTQAKNNDSFFGRGAGGHCFIKDFAAFVSFYSERLKQDEAGLLMLQAIETKNIDLLLSTNKDLDLLSSVYY